MATEFRKDYLEELKKYQVELDKYFSDIQTPDFEDIKEEYEDVIKKVVAESENQVIELGKLNVSSVYSMPDNFISIVKPTIVSTDSLSATFLPTLPPPSVSTASAPGSSIGSSSAATTSIGSSPSASVISGTSATISSNLEEIIKLFGPEGPYEKENVYDKINKDLDKTEKETDWMWWLMPSEIEGQNDPFKIVFTEPTVKEFLTYQPDKSVSNYSILIKNMNNWLKLINKLNGKITSAEDFTTYFKNDIDIKKALTFYITWCVWRAEVILAKKEIVNIKDYQLKDTLDSICGTFGVIQKEVYEKYKKELFEINIFRKSKSLREIEYVEETSEFTLAGHDISPLATDPTSTRSTKPIKNNYVMIYGLKKSTEYNGKYGELIGASKDKPGRSIIILLEDSRKLSLKAENFRILKEEEKECILGIGKLNCNRCGDIYGDQVLNQCEKSKGIVSSSPLSYKRQVSPTGGKIRSIQKKKNNRVKNLKKEMKKKQK